MERFRFVLLCPERQIYAGEADHVVAPGVEGEFGILPGHCPFASTLKTGVVRLLDADAREVRRFCVRGGFAEVAGDDMAILAEEAVDVADIDKAALAERLADAADDADAAWVRLLEAEAA